MPGPVKQSDSGSYQRPPRGSRRRAWPARPRRHLRRSHDGRRARVRRVDHRPVPGLGLVRQQRQRVGRRDRRQVRLGRRELGGSDPYGNVTLSTGSYAMQSLWSNSASACVMSAPVSTPPVVTGISPTHGPTAGGTVVTVTGTGLTRGTVAFGANAAPAV